ncbi:DUF4192 family protein [Arthrobacter sp. ISL-72]|uniref:DUF4192 family protein n=1 Tax=Arthrobacter sp. ISL-72 TaxID=2819114 RepID=UPI001BED1C0E|nr:DUF4192 family protein [Arthrobacter sp. ISL-72]MBT2597930.1 DUF4192 family protein [Arthrobacter sp. ISL-72]
MEPLTIKTPADVLSFVGHTLRFWPHESLVCITLDTNRVGATLRVDLPNREGGLRYARTSPTTSPMTPAPPACSSPCTPLSHRNPGSPARSNHRNTNRCAGRTLNDYP